MIYFTSDTHFSHAKITLYCPSSRGHFKSIEEMNWAMVNAWNERVQPEDTIYHLGDFAMGGKENIPKWLARLNGKKILIRGNHDKGYQFMLDSGFDEVHDSLVLEEQGKKLFLHHQPVYKKSLWPEGIDFAFCGHVHDDWARYENIINVGVDVSGMKPLTLEELLVRDPPQALGELRVEECGYCFGKKTIKDKKCPECYGEGMSVKRHRQE